MYLTEGLICLEETDQSCFLFDLVTGERRRVDLAQAQAARQLVRGLDGPEANRASQHMSALGSAGAPVMEPRDEPFDRVIRRRLERLDGSFSWSLPPGADALLDLCEHAHSLLRHSRLDLDQLPALPETAARRALLLKRLCRPGAKVAFVGDDDLVSIAAAACGLRPTVLDIDTDLAMVVDLIARRFALEVEVRPVDLRDPLPPDLAGRFDAFSTDPENSRECICLFLSRGISLVRSEGMGLIASAEEWEHLIDEAVDRTRTRRLAVHRRFNNYRDWSFSLAPYRADLHVLSISEESQPLVSADDTFEGELFPFGLSGKESIVFTVTGCLDQTLDGEVLIDLLRELAPVFGGDPSTDRPPVIEDRSPLPVRVVSVSSPSWTAQATVTSGGSGLDLVLTPSPPDDERVRRIMALTAERLCPCEIEVKALQRVDFTDA